MACSCPTPETVHKVDIDPNGEFKYILVKVYDNYSEASALIVRGYKRCAYHANIFKEVQAELKHLVCEPLGGGTISHDRNNMKIQISGKSERYGKADHEESAKLVKAAFPGYTVSIIDENETDEGIKKNK